jgi:FMN phosphatase YigB (HAD superfamily)
MISFIYFDIGGTLMDYTNVFRDAALRFGLDRRGTQSKDSCNVLSVRDGDLAVPTFSYSTSWFSLSVRLYD